MAVEGYETGEHAPGLKLRGTGAYRAAHHIIKVRGHILTRYSGILESSNLFITVLCWFTNRHTLRCGTLTILTGEANKEV